MVNNKVSYKKIAEYFKDKKILFAHWDAENKEDYSYQSWYSPLSKIFGDIITFSPKKVYFNYGKKIMNEKFLELIKKERPDIIYLCVMYDEFELETFFKIREILPNVKIINIYGDDNWRFDNFSRFYSLFFDYIIICQPVMNLYKKDKINNVFFYYAVNLDNFKPLNLEKKYDVVFIGSPSPERADYLKFLLDKKVKLSIWGNRWGAYKEFNNVYHGPLNSDDWVKIVNQSKICLNFTLGVHKEQQIKGRAFEVAACKVFLLSTYNPKYFDFFKNNKEIVMFKNKAELISKIEYYLSMDVEREKIAENSYKRIVNECNMETEISKIFMKIKSDEINNVKLKTFPKIDRKVIYLTKKDIISNNIKEKLNGYDYVCFKNKLYMEDKFRVFFQAYSIEKSGKEISICDYYVYSKNLGNYLLFKASSNFFELDMKNFLRLLTPYQIMVKKSYFIENINFFKNIFDNGKMDFISEKNTTFVSIPLIKISKITKHIDYKIMKIAFQPKFLNKLYSNYFQKKFLNSYPFYLLIKSFKMRNFILNVIIDTLFDKDKINKLKTGFN